MDNLEIIPQNTTFPNETDKRSPTLPFSTFCWESRNLLPSLVVTPCRDFLSFEGRGPAGFVPSK